MARKSRSPGPSSRRSLTKRSTSSSSSTPMRTNATRSSTPTTMNTNTTSPVGFQNQTQKQPGLFAQMASTAAGVAVGSAVVCKIFFFFFFFFFNPLTMDNKYDLCGLDVIIL
ncbi:hypothetical protein HMI56_006098 [Coelomomyces lativittatus]|nr:hypothetical protein HMI56_006098 [Coelomomyces lativittatus]